MLRVIIGMIAAYLIGSVPVSFLIGKIRGIDIRKEGSGNIGATNVLRTAGKWPAIIALSMDILKGVIAVTVLPGWLGTVPAKASLGLCAVAGHAWSVFLRFKGGKGVATSVGVLAILVPAETILGLSVFFAATWLSKYVSLGSIAMSIAIPIAVALSGKDVGYVLLSVTLGTIICYKHKENIKRLMAGTENRINQQK